MPEAEWQRNERRNAESMRRGAGLPPRDMRHRVVAGPYPPGSASDRTGKNTQHTEAPMPDPWADTRDPNVAVTNPSLDDSGRFERTGETIDLTPTWTALVPFHLGVLDGSIGIVPEHRERALADARAEIIRMARIADLHVAESKRRPTGEMGLPLEEIGMVVQSIARAIVDRGEYTAEQVLRELGNFKESTWWETYGGPAIDQLEGWLFGHTPPSER